MCRAGRELPVATGELMVITQMEIYWCSLVSSERTFVYRSLSELGEQLAERYPTLPRLTFRELSDLDRDRVGTYLVRKIRKSSDPAPDVFVNKLLFVFCSPNDEVASAMQQENRMAEWGGAQRGSFAVAWKLNPHLLWHEAMHLLHAADCYNESGHTECDEPRCLMQYEPCIANCGSELVLCEGNIKMVANNA